jgi:hypothetical protein
MRDLEARLNAVASLTAANRTADANGTGVDLQGYDGALIVAVIGAEGDTLSGSVKIEIEVEESDDDSTYTDVANADLLGNVTGTNTGTVCVIDDNTEAPAVHKVAYVGNKRYIRAVDNRTGTHTVGTPTAAVVVRGYPHRQPL